MDTNISSSRFRKIFTGLFICLAALVSQAATSWKFDFTAKGMVGFNSISPADKYSAQTGYGFDFGSDTAVAFSSNGDGIEGLPAPKNPYDWTGYPFYAPTHSAFFFSADVPAGNYEVKITLGNKDSAVRATIRAEQRRLMIEDWQIPAGQTQTRVIHVNRRTDTVAGTATIINPTTNEIGRAGLDNRLTIEFNGNRPVVQTLEITQVDTDITVYLAGTSTVFDASTEPYSTWGMNLTRFFKPGVAISNQSEGGLTATSFINQGRLQNILGTLKKNDLVFVSFGESDQKWSVPDSLNGNYRNSLATFATQVTAKGGTIVFVTPTARLSFDTNGRAQNTLGSYPTIMKSVATQTGSSLLDMTTLSTGFIEALGPINASKAYAFFPANTIHGMEFPLEDIHHWNDYGGYELAKAMATAIRQQNLSITRYLSDDYVDFDPSKPDPPEGFALPFSPDFMPFDQVPDAIHQAKGSSASVPRIGNALIREGVLTLRWNGNVDGTWLRVHGLDGVLLASTALPRGTESVHLPIPRTTHCVLLVELVRDGQILDTRKVVP